MKKLILTHANCVDGCCSRAILESKYGNDAEYIAIEHSDYDPKFPDKVKLLMNNIETFNHTEVIMSDICLPIEWINQLLEKNNKVTIIDHHKTATSTINELMSRINNGEKINVDIHFSVKNTQSAAFLTWNYINPTITPPDVIYYISEGDIWNFEHEETKPFYTGLLDNKEPKDYSPSQWLDLINNEDRVKAIIAHGRPIHEQFMSEVNSFLPKAQPIILDGRHGLMVLAPSRYRSEVGNLLAKTSGDFGLVVGLSNENDIVSCRLNSVAPVEIDAIAKKFGGGGHAQSSAFKVKNLSEFEKLLKKEGNTITLNLNEF
jgi:uncharacterized protein